MKTKSHLYTKNYSCIRQHIDHAYTKKKHMKTRKYHTHQEITLMHTQQQSHSTEENENDSIQNKITHIHMKNTSTNVQINKRRICIQIHI